MLHKELVESDYVLTPEWCAKDIIEHFAPTGRLLDPCRGLNKVFYNQMPGGADWCEIQEGSNFFEYNKSVDWIIGNPPYSIFNDWMEHSFAIADNIVYLLPTFKIFNALGLCRMYGQNGWIRHIRFYDVGRKIEWSRSRPIVAVHFQKNYFGDTSWSYYDKGNKLFHPQYKLKQIKMTKITLSELEKVKPRESKYNINELIDLCSRKYVNRNGGTDDDLIEVALCFANEIKKLQIDNTFLIGCIGLKPDDVMGAFLAFKQIQSKGKLTEEENRRTK